MSSAKYNSISPLESTTNPAILIPIHLFNKLNKLDEFAIYMYLISFPPNCRFTKSHLCSHWTVPIHPNRLDKILTKFIRLGLISIDYPVKKNTDVFLITRLV